MPRQPASRSLIDIMEAEYAPLRRLSSKSIAVYQVTIRHFDRWLATAEARDPGPSRIEDLSDLTVAKFIVFREQERCTATAHRDKVQLCALWRYCARKRYVEEWPELPPMRVPKRAVKAYTRAELDRLLEYFATLEGTIDDVPQRDWWAELVRILFEGGTRITETRLIEWPDVDLHDRTILFRAENRKNKTRDIVRDISPETAERLAQRAKSAGRVFPWPKNATFLWWHMKRHCQRAGVPYRGFHGIRRSACSYTKAAGGDATQLADHSSPAVTERYIDLSIAKPESNLDRLPALGRADEDTAAVEEHALRGGYQAGKALAAAAMPKPTRETASALAVAAGFGKLATWYAHGLAMGWDSQAGEAAA
jgi:integrase